MILIFLLLSLLSTIEAFTETKCPVNFCDGTYPAEDLIEKFCENKGSMIDRRCCNINDTDTIIGLDLTSCDIGRLNITSYNFTDVVIMDLWNNSHLDVTSDDLEGLVHLDKLYLPLDVLCPGGNKSWNDISTDENKRVCKNQINPCIALNISCTENGECIHTGPGSAKCICLPGHYGYKCLNEGEFPTAVFSVSLVTSAIVLCIALWFAVGRDAHKSLYSS